MKEKKWVDCPICGSIGTMKYKSNITQIIKNKKYAPITIKDLDGYFCSKCGEGFLTKKSNNSFNSQLAKEKAKQDSFHTPVTDILDVKIIMEKLDVTRQRVNQMMNEGKLHYILWNNKKYPTKENEKNLNTLKKTIHHNTSANNEYTINCSEK